MTEYDPYDMAIVGKIVELKEGGEAIVDFNGVRRDVQLGLVDAEVGDYVLVHAGYAIRKMDEREIKAELLRMIGELQK